MRTKIRGIQHIPSIMKSRLQRQVRSEHEMFNELARLGREKEWLNKEKRTWQEKLERIDARLEEIAELQYSLQRQVSLKEEANRDARDVKQADEYEKREVVIRY